MQTIRIRYPDRVLDIENVEKVIVHSDGSLGVYGARDENGVFQFVSHIQRDYISVEIH